MSDRMEKHSIELKTAKKTIDILESELKKAKLALVELIQLKENLDVTDHAQDSSNAAIT